MMAPGGPYETRPGPHGEPLFADHPRSLQAMYRIAAADPARRLIEHEGRAYSSGEIFGWAARIARWLRDEQGVAAGDGVALAMPTSPEWVAAFIAVTAIGGYAVLVNTRGAGEEMLRAVDALRCKVVVADAQRAAAMLGERPRPDWTFLLAGAPEALRSGRDRAIADFAPGPHDIPDAPDSAPDDGAIVLFTSGTTGYPKAVLHSHGGLAHAAVLGGMLADLQDRAYEREFAVTLPPERRAASAATVIAAPLFHMGGVIPLVRGLYFGAPLFLMPKWNAEIAFDLMERETVTRLGFVPTMLLDMIRSPLASDQNLGSITLLSNGAASLDPRIVAEIRAKMPRVMLANSYGQTESAGWATSIYGDDYLTHPNSAGYVLPTMELRVATADGSDAEPGEHGDILVRGPCIMREYLGAPEATAETLADGWLHTGDIGWTDEDGRLFIADRKKNMVISGGENIYCAEIERVIGDYPGVAEVIAYGRPDERLGERIAATVVPAPGATIETEALRAYIRTRLAGYKVPRDIALRTEALPRTASMKIDRGTFLRTV